MASLGRASRAYVSAYDRGRVVSVRLYPQETRQLVADFNGALEEGRTISQAVWDMYILGYASMASGAIDGRATSVLLTASYRGQVAMRCQVTLDNGEVMNQLFAIEIFEGPLWNGDGQSIGPSRITVSA